MSKPKENYRQHNDVWIWKPDAGNRGRVHKWRKNQVDRDFKQLEEKSLPSEDQSGDVCRICTGSGISTSACMIQGHLTHPVIPAWVERSVKCRTGKSCIHQASPSASCPCLSPSQIETRDGWAAGMASPGCHCSQGVPTPSGVWEVFMIPWGPGGSLFFKESSSRVISDFLALKSYLGQTKVLNQKPCSKGRSSEMLGWGRASWRANIPKFQEHFFPPCSFLPQQLSAPFWAAQTHALILWVSAKATLFCHLWHLSLCLLPARILTRLSQFCCTWSQHPTPARNFSRCYM